MKSVLMILAFMFGLVFSGGTEYKKQYPQEKPIKLTQPITVYGPVVGVLTVELEEYTLKIPIEIICGLDI